MEKIVYNARIITMNREMDIIGQGYLRIKDGKITEIGQAGTLNIGAETHTEYTDAQGMFLIPGFVNTHTHLPMTMLRGFADDLPLHQWLTEHIFPAEARLVTPDHVRIATRLALIEMIKSGTTCFNDMYFYEDVIAEEARKAGIRGVMNESLIDFPTASFQTPDEGLRLSERLIQNGKTIRSFILRSAPMLPIPVLRTPCKKPKSWRINTIHSYKYTFPKPGKKWKISPPGTECRRENICTLSGCSIATSLPHMGYG